MNLVSSTIILLFTGGTLLTFGDIAMKKWIVVSGGSFSNGIYYYISGLLFYSIGLTLFAFSLKHKNLAIATVILIFFNVLTILIAGYLFFNEKFSLLQIFGIFLGLLSIVVFEIAE